MSRYAVIDIETTGGNSAHHRITEIAIFIHDGTRIVDHFETLINPQRRIPGYIEGFTGITNQMVEGAPTFDQVAERIDEITKGCVFVAHNVNFDYSFIRKEFSDTGRMFRRNKLCTVRLSRAIIPGLPSYGLGSICQSLNIPIKARHRAGGDGEATVKLLEILLEKDTEDHIGKALKRGSKEAVLPPNLPAEQYNALPESTGVYYFQDKHGNILYIGKARNLRARVTSHFQGNTNTRSRQLFMERIWGVDYEVCGNELIALLHESTEIKKYWPPMNRAQKNQYFSYGIYQYIDQNGYVRFNLNKVTKGLQPILTFYSLLEAREWLQKMVREHALCPKLAGLQQSVSTCHDHKAGLCDGACGKHVKADEYNTRTRAFLESLDQPGESYVVLSNGRTSKESSVVLVEDGKYRGYGYIDKEYSITGTAQLADYIQPAEDNPDARAILHSFLARDPKLEVVLI